LLEQIVPGREHYTHASLSKDPLQEVLAKEAVADLRKVHGAGAEAQWSRYSNPSVLRH
jgi:hypothetical protein